MKKAEDFTEELAKSNWGLRLILEKISDAQKPVLYRLMEQFQKEGMKEAFEAGHRNTVVHTDVIVYYELMDTFEEWYNQNKEQ